MSLPNNLNSVKVYPNEYITNVTVNRGLSRCIANDEYLLGQMNGVTETQSQIDAVSAQVQLQGNQINANITAINSHSTAINNLGVRMTTAEYDIDVLQTMIDTTNNNTITGLTDVYVNIGVITGDVSGINANIAVLSADVGLLSSYVRGITADVALISADVLTMSSDIAAISAGMSVISNDVATISSNLAPLLTGAMVHVDVPAGSGSPGSLGQCAVSGAYFYVYSPSGMSGYWGRVTLDFSF